MNVIDALMNNKMKTTNTSINKILPKKSMYNPLLILNSLSMKKQGTIIFDDPYDMDAIDKLIKSEK